VKNLQDAYFFLECLIQMIDYQGIVVCFIGTKLVVDIPH